MIKPLKSSFTTVGLVSDGGKPLIWSDDVITVIDDPSPNDSYDVLVYLSCCGRRVDTIQKAIREATPIIGYKTCPLMEDLINRELAFELLDSDDHMQAVYNTVMYIGSDPAWQIMNTFSLFRYSKEIGL